MASPELTDEENAHLRALLKAAIPRHESQNKLAAKLGMAGSSLGKIVEKGGGASKETARKFAELEGKTFEEVIGRGKRGRADRPSPLPASRPPMIRPTARALGIAKDYLMEPPQRFSEKAIESAAEEVYMTNPPDADKPSAVAEAIRHVILGSAVNFPPHPAPPSTMPPEGTRRSRMRGR